MKKIDVIGDVYRPLLLSLGCRIGEDQTIYLNDKAAVVMGKTLVMPTEDKLNAANGQHVFFHPLSENIARGDSPIFKWLKAAIQFRLSVDMSIMLGNLLSIANDETVASKLKASQLDLLTACSKVNDKAVQIFSSVQKKFNLTNHKIVNIYNGRNGKIDGVTYNRAAVVTFPMLEGIRDENNELWKSAKLRKADYGLFEALFEYAYPKLFEEDAWSYGSDSMDAPSLEAMIGAYLKLARRNKDLVAMFEDVCDFSQVAMYTKHLDDIVDFGPNISKYASCIPALEGNIGDVASNESGVAKNSQAKGVPPSDLAKSFSDRTAAIGAEVTPQVVQQQMQQQPMMQQQAVVPNVQPQQELTQAQKNQMYISNSDFNTDINLQEVFASSQPMYNPAMGQMGFGNQGYQVQNNPMMQQQMSVVQKLQMDAQSSDALVRYNAEVELAKLKNNPWYAGQINAMNNQQQMLQQQQLQQQQLMQQQQMMLQQQQAAQRQQMMNQQAVNPQMMGQNPMMQNQLTPQQQQMMLLQQQQMMQQMMMNPMMQNQMMMNPMMGGMPKFKTKP